MTVGTYVLECDWAGAGELLANPDIESAVSGTCSAFDDQFADLNAWTLDNGSAFSVASNLVSRGATDGAMNFGHPDWWDISAGTRFRFKWVTGGSVYFFVRFVDGNNWVAFFADGANLYLQKTIASATTTLVLPAAVLTNGNFYWLQPTITGTTYGATLDNDSAGSPGANIVTISAQTITDAVVQKAAMSVRLQTAAMQLGGNFADVCLVKIPAPPSWTVTVNAGVPAFAVSKANKYSGAYSLSIYNNHASADGMWVSAGLVSLSANYVVTARVKTLSVTGTGLEVSTSGGDPQIPVVTGTHDWTGYSGSGNPTAGTWNLRVRLHLASGTAWFDSGSYGAWVDETAYLLSADWKRGRDYASQLTGRASAGQLDVQLRNIDGRFASFNSAGALYGKLLPGRRVRIRTTSPTAEILWTGFIDEIRPNPGSRESAPTALLRASGPLKWIAARRASTAVYTSTLTGAAVGYILDDAGWPAAARVIDAGQITMARWKADGDSALSHLQELEEMEIGSFIVESKDGQVIFEDANHRAVSPHTVSQATFSDAQGAALSYDQVEQFDPWSEVFNRFEADVVLFTVQSLAVLWSLAGEIPSIGAGVTKDFWVGYPTPDAAAQADHVDAWTTPVVTTDFLANTQADGLGTNKSAAITVATSKFANSMKISLTNTDGGTVFITFLQARGTAVYKNDPIRVVSEDTTSQTKYGKRTFPLPGKFYPTTTVAQSYVQAGVSRYKDPLAIVRVTYQANTSDAHMTQALTRTISDRISLRAQGDLASGAQLGINADFFIEAERHHYDLSGHWVTYELSDARTVSGYWILGTSDLGNTTKLGL
jgi:hypothetical protein